MKRIYVFTLCLAATFLCAPYGAAAEEQSNPFAQALKTAYQTNPSLNAAREELKSVEELYPQALSGWRPTVSASASLFTTDVESSNFSQGTGATTKDMSLNVDQPLIRGGRTWAERSRARAFIDAANMITRSQEQSVMRETLTIIANITRDEALLDVRKQTENAIRKDLEASRARYKYGELTITDVKQAQARHQRAISSRLSAHAQLYQSHAAFEDVAGYPAPKNMMLPILDWVADQNLFDIVNLGKDRNLNLKIAKFQKTAAEHDVDAIFRELLPQISAFASYNKQYDPQPGITDETESSTIGIRATLALYQGGNIRSRLREAKYTEAQRSYDVQDVERGVQRNITSNWHEYQALKGRLQAREEEARAAKEALDGVRKEAEIGERSLLDILDAQQELLEARAQVEVIKHDLFTEQINLMVNSGVRLASYFDVLDDAEKKTH